MKSKDSFVEEKMEKELSKIEVDPDIIGPSTIGTFDDLFTTLQSKGKTENVESNSQILKFSNSMEKQRRTNIIGSSISIERNLDEKSEDMMRRFSLQMERFDKKSNLYKKKYAEFDKKYSQMKESSKNANKDIYSWLKVGGKFSHLKKKVRAKVVEMLRSVRKF